MDVNWTELGAVDPKSLVEARLQAHHAVQWVTRAARANLAAQPDDSHSSLSWRQGALVSQHLPAKLRFGLRVSSLTLFAERDGRPAGDFALDGRRDAEAGAWIDAVAKTAGLAPASGVALPYEIVATVEAYTHAPHRAEFAALARWYAAAADILEEIRVPLAGASALRCWPHHFDIAMLLTLTASSLGIGMSPGDDTYAQPYFYVSPWPRPSTDKWPELLPPGHWHSGDFVAAVVTGDAIVAMAERRDGVRRFLDAAIPAARGLIGAS